MCQAGPLLLRRVPLFRQGLELGRHDFSGTVGLLRPLDLAFGRFEQRGETSRVGLIEHGRQRLVGLPDLLPFLFEGLLRGPQLAQQFFEFAPIFPPLLHLIGC